MRARPPGVEVDSCELCARGDANLCATMSTRALGFTAPGGMSEWFRVPEAHLVPLPPELDLENASLVEPASVACARVTPR